MLEEIMKDITADCIALDADEAYGLIEATLEDRGLSVGYAEEAYRIIRGGK